MAKSYQVPAQEPSDNFSPESFVIFCLDAEGNVAFEASWGNSIEDVKKFGALLSNVTSGEFNAIILEQLKEQSKTLQNGMKKFNVLQKIINNSEKPSDLVIDPTEVELN